jgi:hypothetical protein
MKLFQIDSLKNTLNILSQKELSFKLAYKISTLTDQIEKDSEFFRNKFRDIILKYAERDQEGEVIFDGDNVKIRQKDIPAAEKELDELNNVETTETNIFFTIDEFEGLEIKPSELTGLLPFIKEE